MTHMTIFGPIADSVTASDPVITWFLAPILAYFYAATTGFFVARSINKASK